MSERFLKYGHTLLFLVLAGIAGCSAEITPTAPQSAEAKAGLTAEPLVLNPETVHGSPCTDRPGFGLRLTIVLRGGGIILRGLRFGFTDTFGATAFPQVLSVPGPGLFSSLPVTSPVTLPGIAALPGISPIPIPGSSPIQGLISDGRTPMRLPFFLRFGCGTLPSGTLLVGADLADMHGRFDRSDIRLRVGD